MVEHSNFQLSDILNKLRQVKPAGYSPQRFRALCPVHQGSGLLITREGDGLASLACKVGCDEAEIMKALNAEGSQV